MNEFLVLFFGFALITGLPVGLMHYIRKIKEQKYIRKIDLKVKNNLLAKDSYSKINPDTVRLVKNSLIRNFIVRISLYTAVLYAYAFLFAEKETIIYFIIISVIIAIFLIFKILYDIKKISETESLIKIKGFLFREKGWQRSVIYYDMKKLKYRIFSYNTFFTNNYSADLGSFVNLIAIRKKSKVKIIRLLSF
ncbi:MAG: hypothetical protein K2J08_01295 [Ruminococcus sp.]|nr:hypothetical protein [Ruminococcus sp.]